MDIFAHALWAGAGGKKLNRKFEEKKKSKISLLWVAFWGIFPDLFAFAIPTLISAWQVLGQGKSLLDISHHGPHLSPENPGFDMAWYLYQYSHSIIIFLLIFSLVWLIFKKPKLVMLGWLLHIILDIPSHSLQFFPTPFLFPLSDYKFPYGIRWSNQIFLISNYSLLVLTYLYLFLKRKKMQKIS